MSFHIRINSPTLYIIIFITIFSNKQAGAQTVFFVSPDGSDNNSGSIDLPFHTIYKANQVVRQISSDIEEDVIVYLREGIYELEEPVIIDNSLELKSGHKLIYRAYQDEKPIISGGKKITGWQPHEGRIIKTFVGNNADFRQLYINGRAGIKSREPNVCQYFQINNWDKSKFPLALKVPVTHIPTLESTEGVEVVIQKNWTINILRLQEIHKEGQYAYLVPKKIERDRSLSRTFPRKKPAQYYHMANAYEFLDSPYEWFYDRETQELFYYLAENELVPNENPVRTLNSNDEELDFIIPNTEQLFVIRGEENNSVGNIVIEGLSFRYTNWTYPNHKGYVGFQGNVFISDNFPLINPCAIMVQNAKDIDILDNRFKDLGADGIILHSNVKSSEISGNIIKDIAGSGIVIDKVLYSGERSPKALCKNIHIQNNLITRVGTEYLGSVGIFAGFTDSLVVEHNELYNLPYTGISIGWGWTTRDTNLRNNIVRNNYLHNVVNHLDDGGAIYTLSKQPNTLIEGNLIRNIKRSKWSLDFPTIAIYLDQGSDEITVRNNIFHDVERKVYQNKGRVGENNLILSNKDYSGNSITDAGLQLDYLYLLNELSQFEGFCPEENFINLSNEFLKIDIFPNPAEKYVNILYQNSLIQDSEIKLLDSMGRILKSYHIKDNDKLVVLKEIDLQDLKAGVYLIKIQTVDNQETRKIIVR